jgi:hypothetical protein
MDVMWIKSAGHVCDNARSVLKQACSRAPAGSYFPSFPRVPSKILPMPEMTTSERSALEAEFARLREEHRDLDAAIEALTATGPVDQLQLQRFKKRKLLLRDRITFLEDQLTPDIIA